MATQSHQGRHTFCYGENERVTNWNPVHVDHAGFDEGTSVVTAMAAHAPLPLSEGNVDHPGPEDVLGALAAAGDAAHATTGHPGELVFALSVDHAGSLAETTRSRRSRSTSTNAVDSRTASEFCQRRTTRSSFGRAAWATTPLPPSR